MSKIFDMSYIEKMSAGDVGTKKQLIQILITELQNSLPRAAPLLATKKWEELGRFCHHFKSTIAFTGNKSLIKANTQLWDIAKKQGKSSANADRILETMQQQAQSIIKEAKSALKKI